MALRPKSKTRSAKKKKPARDAGKGAAGRRTKNGGLAWRKLVVRLSFWVLAASLLAGGFYAWHLSVTIEHRFAGRRWSLPSRVYADSMMLFAGQEYNKNLVLANLEALGYRRVNERNIRPGQCRAHAHSLDVYLRQLELPGHKRPAMAIRLTFGKRGIISMDRIDQGRSPGVVQLEPRPVAQFFGSERESRILISLAKIPPHLARAFLAAEDADFYRHSGVDLPGILRALWINLWAGSVRQGGSTITQQLAKNYFLTPERTLLRKIRELFIALILEMKYSKDTILEIYLNEVYLGQMGSVAVNGVGEAAHFYFGKPAEELNVPESALLAAVLRGPNYYSPHRHPKRVKERRDWVIAQMVERGWLDPTLLEKARRAPLGLAPFRKYRRQAPYFVDYVSHQLKELYSEDALSSLGLGIYTTLDLEVQTAAEQALIRGLERLEKVRPKLRSKSPAKCLQGAIIVMQPQTGNILAMVGGRDYSASQFNRATRAYRQPGSTFKPFVYLAALDQFTPASGLSNQSRVYKVGGQNWQPANYKPHPASQVSLRTALAMSLNLPTVDLAMQVGLNKVAAVARGFGFEGEMKPYPSLALGALEVRPLELARAYCAFAADGVLPYPMSVNKVADENGKVALRRHVSKESITTPAKAYIMDSLLRSAVLNGTGQGLGRLGVTIPVAGKTGTTNDFRDAWFVGYTPDIMALVWVGFDDNRSVGFSGGGAALPIWAELVKAIPWRTSGSWFKQPPGVVTALVCADSGQAPSSGCHKVVEEIFLQSNLPQVSCQLHGGNNPAGNVLRSISDAVREFFN